ncbi:MAG: hypothetical protein COB37_00460 [Kordiimonadales bacterium]|nr:MAG: hypothetical protein COB37_00460 [Kordiimonadales bacterium]
MKQTTRIYQIGSSLVGRLLICLCLLAGGTQFAAAQYASPRIYDMVGGYPIEKDTYGRMMVGVHVNGQGPFPFILDTGASRSIIYRSLTSRMHLQSVENKSRRIITVSGYVRALVYPIKDVYALGASLKLEDTVALPDVTGSEALGLLGVDLLAGKTLEIRHRDYIAKLHASPLSLRGDGWQFIQGKPVAYGSLALEIDVGGVSIPLIVDTGASHTIINKAGADTLMRSAQGVARRKIAPLIIGGIHANEQVILPVFALGPYVTKDKAIYVSDLPIFSLLGARRVPAIILGMDVLGEQGFAIDFANWRLYLNTKNELPVAITAEAKK